MSTLWRITGRRTAARVAAAVLALGAMILPRPARAADSAEDMYTRAMAQERQVRDVENRPTLPQLRGVVQAYESIVLRFPKSGYCDNALWQGAGVALLASERFGQAADRRTALRLLNHLKNEYPASPLTARVATLVREIETKPEPASAAAGADAPIPQPVVSAAPALESRDLRPVVDTAPAAGANPIVTIREIKRTAIPDGIRVSVEMDGEVLYRSERLDNPRRVFFDLKGARSVPSLQDATLKFTDDIVREIRLGRHPQNTTRVVMDLESVENFSVFTLYNPYRLVVDFRRTIASAAPAPAIAPGITPPLPGPTAAPETRGTSGLSAKSIAASKEPVPIPPRTTPPPVVSPTVPTTNSNGQFSLARQLGLGVSRIVLDAGHGGHDPGARSNGLNEAELVLDVTLRLKHLLEKQPGIEVTLTRDGDVFVPLEQRTAIANRQGADLFLSIHANASRNPRARGIETYFLNFATNPEAEAVAARENSASGKTMHSLPDIVRAIALNNKIDESRDFAASVQKAMVRRLTARNSQLRDLGVKQAPFVVLIGAGMPSVLAEISFVTNKADSALLKTSAYRQQIAESLLDGVLRYQQSLKGVRAVASKE